MNRVQKLTTGCVCVFSVVIFAGLALARPTMPACAAGDCSPSQGIHACCACCNVSSCSANDVLNCQDACGC